MCTVYSVHIEYICVTAIFAGVDIFGFLGTQILTNTHTTVMSVNHFTTGLHRKLYHNAKKN